MQIGDSKDLEPPVLGKKYPREVLYRNVEDHSARGDTSKMPLHGRDREFRHLLQTGS